MDLTRHEPARLVNSDSTDEFTLRLLRSANDDQPSVCATSRAMVRITALLAEESEASCAAHPQSKQPTARISDFVQRNRLRASTAGPLRITRAAGVGLLLGTSLAAAVVGVTLNTTREAQPALTQPTSPPHKLEPPLRSTARARGPNAERISDRPEPLPAPPKPRPEPKPARPSNSDLSQELALLDTAKIAFSQGDFEASLKALDDANKLSRRVLVPEATVLRVRALIALKRDKQARRLVERFVAQSPNSPVNPVLHDLVAPLEKQ